jgi:hypothetical protein
MNKKAARFEPLFISTAVTDENGFLDAPRHVRFLSLVAVRGLYRKRTPSVTA